MTRIYFILFCLISFCSFSQRGKDGSVNITVANTIVNLYTPLTQNASVGNKTLTVQLPATTLKNTFSSLQ